MLTRDFQSLPLYPGGDLLTGIVFSDPYPDDSLRPNNVYRLTFPYSEVVPLIWNSKEWTTSLAVDVNLTDSGTGLSLIGSYSAAGKYLSAEIAAAVQDVFYSNNRVIQFLMSSTDAEPVDRILGMESFDNKQNAATSPGAPIETQGDKYTNAVPRLLPSVNLDCSHIPYFGGYSGPTVSVSEMINNEHDEEVGDVTLTMSGSGQGSSITANIEALKIWVKGDGNVELFLQIDFSTGDGLFNFVQFYNKNPGTGLVSLASFTLSILGQDIMTQAFTSPGILDFFTGIVLTGSFVYSVTQDEPWEYPT